MSFSGLLIPGLLRFVGLWGLAHRVDVSAALLQGASEGLRVLLRIFPALVALLSAVAMPRILFRSKSMVVTWVASHR